MCAYALSIRRAATICDQRNLSAGWLEYDAAFRRQMAVEPGRRWATVDAERWTLLVLSAPPRPPLPPPPATTQQMTAPPPPPPAPPRPPGAARVPVGAANMPCFAFNRPSGCLDNSCPYGHFCRLCRGERGEHSALNCPSLSQAGAGPPSTGAASSSSTSARDRSPVRDDRRDEGQGGAPPRSPGAGNNGASSRSTRARR